MNLDLDEMIEWFTGILANDYEDKLRIGNITDLVDSILNNEYTMNLVRNKFGSPMDFYEFLIYYFDVCINLEKLDLSVIIEHNQKRLNTDIKFIKLYQGDFRMNTPITLSEENFRNVKIIPANSFSHWYKLASVTLGNNVTKIEDRAFERCSSLNNFIISNSVESIGFEAFTVSALSEIIIPGNVKEISKSAFSYCRDLKKVVLQNGIEEIRECAFDYCLLLSDINIPDSVKYLGKAAFSQCKELKNVIIGNGISKILSRTFYYCNSLSNLKIGSGVKKIGPISFYHCEQLETIILPDNSGLVIDDGAFSYCEKLQNFIIPNINIHFYDSVFYNCYNLSTLTYKGTLSDYNKKVSYEKSWLANSWVENLKASDKTITIIYKKPEEFM